MVYVPQETVTWSAYVSKWLSGLDMSEGKELIYSLFEHSIPQGAKLLKNLTQPVPTVFLQLIANICDIIEIMVNKTKVHNWEAERRNKGIHSIYAFAYIWGIGGSLDAASQERFSDLVRQLLAGKA